MKRANGLDADGNPMTVRGGVADLLQDIEGGRMLIAYSGGLHHVQVPSQLIPRPFKTLKMQIESWDILRYKSMLLDQGGKEHFKQSVITDLETRRAAYCSV
jgi:hypothetical protein